MRKRLGLFLIKPPVDQSLAYSNYAESLSSSWAWSSSDHLFHLSSEPILNHRRDLALFFSGTIYNHQSLRQGLRFQSWQTDSYLETLVEALSQRGLSILLDLRGPFAFAAYDFQRNQVLLARDRIGLQPFYLKWCPFGLQFSFDRTSLSDTAHTDLHSAYTFLTQGYTARSLASFGPTSKGVSLFPSGLAARINYSRSHNSVRYWPPQPRADWTTLPISNLSSASLFVRRQLLEVLKQQIDKSQSAVCLLSTGIASSCMSALVSELLPGHVTTLTLSSPDTYSSVSQSARTISRFCGSNNETICIDDVTALSWFEQGLHELDELSYLDPHQYVAIRATSSLGINSVFNARGASDLFGQDQLHSIIPLLRLLLTMPRRIRTTISHQLGGSVSLFSLLPSIRQLLDALSAFHLIPEPSHPFNQLSLTHQQDIDTRCLRQLWSRISWISLFGNTIPLQQLQTATLGLCYNVTTSFPFLDHRIVESALRLPQRFHDCNKQLLLDACSNPFPVHFFDHRSCPLSLPMSAWLRGPLRSLCLTRLQFLNQSAWIDTDSASYRWSSFISGHVSWQEIWKLVILGEFARRALTHS